MEDGAATKRLAFEYRKLQEDNPFNAHPTSEDDFLHWTATIPGPPETPYADGLFTVTVTFQEKYPRQPPTSITFTTPIFHPNVAEDGEVAVAELLTMQWCPAITVDKLLLSLQVLLGAPEVEDGECVLNLEAALLYGDDRELFDRNARQWVDACARGEGVVGRDDLVEKKEAKEVAGEGGLEEEGWEVVHR